MSWAYLDASLHAQKTFICSSLTRPTGMMIRPSHNPSSYHNTPPRAAIYQFDMVRDLCSPFKLISLVLITFHFNRRPEISVKNSWKFFLNRMRFGLSSVVESWFELVRECSAFASLDCNAGFGCLSKNS